MWCHARHLNLNGIKLPRIRKEDKEIAKDLNYKGVTFPVSKKDYGRIDVLNKICINMFCYEYKVVHPVYLSDQKFDKFRFIVNIKLFYFLLCVYRRF